MTPRLMLVTVALLALGQARAEQPACRLVQRVYPVADLVVPLRDVAAARDEKPRTTEAHLMKLITRTIAPESWARLNAPTRRSWRRSPRTPMPCISSAR